MTTQEDPVYIGIENPSEIRRSLLESSKLLIHILQANERQKERRMRKQELSKELIGKMNEATHLVAQLKSLLPKVKVSSLPKKVKPRPAVNHVESKHAPIAMPKPKPVHLTEAQKLEQELKDIEDKLDKL